MSERLSMREYTSEEAYEKGYADGRRDSKNAQEQNEPLTCDGCRYDRRECPSEAFARCDSCVRQERSWMSDRYEAKDEYDERSDGK